jgi:hypothetical protein
VGANERKTIYFSIKKISNETSRPYVKLFLVKLTALAP